MKNPRISVIIPVYNAEKYLQRCVDSVLTQKYKDFELILVNDGSKDGSGTICDLIASKDNCVRVVHQQNAGAGAARNAGLALAQGEYIVFVDSDDVIDTNYFDYLSNHVEDVVFIDVDDVDEEGRIVGGQFMSKYSSCSKDTLLRNQMTGKLSWGGVRKCVKRQLLIENDIRYSNHKIGEEAIYSYLVLRYAKSIGFINTPVYHYMQHGDSLSNTIVEDPWGEVALALKKEIQERGDYKVYGDTINAFIETAAIVSLYKMSALYSISEYKEKASYRWQQTGKHIDGVYPIDRKHQSCSMRLYGVLTRMKMWSIAWMVGRMMQR